MDKDIALRLALEALEKSLPRLAPYGEQDWLDSKEAITAIKAALSGEAQTRSVVKDEPVAHSIVAGALFDFMGWLTSREKRLILSSVDEASPAVEAITEFAKKRNLSLKYAEVGYWMEFLSTPPQQEAKYEPVAIKWEKDADKECRYNNWVGMTPFGRILITWKGWKEWHDACVDEFPGGFEAYGLPDDVKAACEVEYLRRLYTTPPQRKPLTDEEIGDEFVRFQVGGMFTPFLYAVRAIEAALLEKQK